MDELIKMGCNFYKIENPLELYEDDPRIHIGKRSAAGLYCYDCGIYLSANCTQYAHSKGMFKEQYESYTSKSLKSCPHCGNQRSSSGYSAVHKELGFDSNDTTSLIGVQGVSSFTWTMMKHKAWVTKCLIDCPDQKIIIDEYGHQFTADEFIQELKYCMIEFQMYCEFS
jgi:hypothetical protein